ncbi:mannan endo-1,4-beta-mannosidase [Povalibacter uvarum]|uniref:Mannan endo-1,4-beta-mannosidase n=1 Tax=Povalibacter uvarum TaxID=732238 RepID=A0A841HFB3_9GAMM|nr:glycosyl hydrolase [Povalibacter uvarum]MBB6091264.1 mannan endo-1,4-beta-mannosidase [Povalibacter uvarum]
MCSSALRSVLSAAIISLSSPSLAQVNVNGSPAEVLQRLQSSTTLRGMHDTLGGEQATGFAYVERACGQRPQLWSGDFGYSRHPNDHVDYRHATIGKAIMLARGGTLITLSWHQCNPVIDEPCTFTGGVQAPLTKEQWRDLLTQGTSLHRRWQKQMNRLAVELKRLKAAGVTVMLRPYHEGNIPGFWWASGDAQNHKELWRQLHEYFGATLGLDNLLWVWSVSYHPKYWAHVDDYYPGDEVVDVVGVDIYPPTKEGIPAFDVAWRTLREVAPSKPLALSEVSRLPNAQELERRPWAYVVPWGVNMLRRDNPARNICDFYGK